MEGLVSEERFRSLLQGHIGGLVSAAGYVAGPGGGGACFSRPLLHALAFAAADIEELLDAYGAGRNARWAPLRRLVATIRLFSSVGHVLHHILLFLPGYRLVPIEGDFPAATSRALEVVCAILQRSLEEALRTCAGLGMRGGTDGMLDGAYAEELPEGRLEANRSSPKVASPERTVTRVATAFLNAAEEADFIHITQKGGSESHAEWIPEPINEARLRDLEQRFHNLQSLYDTHISQTNVESLDEDLPVLRGHISVIFHLLETATALAHYCERHILSIARQAAAKGAAADAVAPAPVEADAPIVEHEEVLGVLMGYSLSFASRYILSTRSLCHEMLRRYAIRGHITVPVPRYRGFHVRPSTLVAKIVAHYGSEVGMQLETETYNAGFTLDLFRANEKINAVKRRLLAREVYACSPNASLGSLAGDGAALVRKVAHTLFAQSKVVLYERNLSLDGIAPRENETPVEFILRALTQLLATGKIDMEMDVTVTFQGDRRVLEDIRLLAENGYGEDDFGNNLPLPEKLAYLRK